MEEPQYTCYYKKIVNFVKSLSLPAIAIVTAVDDDFRRQNN